MNATQLITVTDAAAARIKTLIETSAVPVEGLRVSVNSKGCSGMSYVFEYAEEKKKLEEEVSTKGIKVFIDSAAIMFLIGSEMDFVEEKLESKFVFSNPNAKSVCGCGESFSL